MRNVECIKGLPFTVKPFKDITDTLVRNDKGNWEPDRTTEQIRRIAVHHSAIEGGSPESYARYHVQTLGWRSIGYHMVIEGDQVLQTNSLLSFTYHTSSNNFDTVSVSVSADLSKRPLSDVERNNLYAVILTYMDIFDIPVESVLGHNEFPGQNTACPSTDMARIRDDVKTIQMKMQQEDTWEAKINKIASMINQFNYFNGLLKAGEKDGNAAWAMSQQMLLYDAMKEKGFL